MWRWSIFCIFFFSLMASSQAAQPSPIPIRFWHHYADGRAAVWADLATAFNTSQTEVAVTIDYYPSYNHQHDALLSGLLNGNLPQVAMVRNYDAALYSLSGRVVDLSPYLAELPVQAFEPLFWEQDRYKGQQLGLPLTRSAEALYINLDLWRERDLGDLPQTREAWAAAACQFREADGLPAAFDLRLDASFWWALANPAAFDLNFGGAVWQTSADWLLDLLKSGCAALTLTPQPSLQNRFASGQTVFYLDSSSARPYIEAAIADIFADPFEVLMLPIPSQTGRVANWQGASLTMFTADPDQQAAAWAWMAWLAQPEQMAIWAEANHAYPARRDVAPPADWQPFAAADWLTEPHPLGYDLIRDEMSFALRAILAGEDAPSRLQSLTEITNHIQATFEINRP